MRFSGCFGKNKERGSNMSDEINMTISIPTDDE